MKLFFMIIFVFNWVSISNSIFLRLKVFQPPPANKVVCESSLASYLHLGTAADAKLNCVDEAILKIEKAVLRPSIPDVCPLQYSTRGLLPFTCGINERDVTEQVKHICNNKPECSIFFGELPSLSCECYNEDIDDVVEDQPRFLQFINVTYTCQTHRLPFVPFANKRYNRKFRPTLNNQMRQISYNNLRNLG